MKRDMDLIRKILLWLELPDTKPFVDVGHSVEQIRYHNYLLVDAGLANGVDVSDLSNPEPEYELTSLTWKGHEFLDAARSETNWKRAKECFAVVGGFSLSVLKELLVTYMKQQIALQE